MKKHLHKTKSFRPSFIHWTVISFFAAILVFSGGFFLATFIHAQSVPFISACVNSQSGEIRIVGAADTCHKNETALSWPQSIPSSTGGSSKVICPGCDFMEEVTGEFTVFPSKNLDNSFIPNTLWNNESLSNFSIQNAYMDAGQFVASTVAGANFTGTKLRGSNFNNANATGVNFTNANLSIFNIVNGKGSVNTTFNATNLTNANLTNANLDGADFSNANLTGATFTGATVTNITLSNTTCPDGSNSNNNSGTCPGL